MLQCINNKANNGGGLGLERSAKIYGVSSENDSINFVSNRASYDGALYVHDETNLDMCTADTIWNATWTTECFLGSLFIHNSAGVSGCNIFGGLLDRCRVHSEYEKLTYLLD